MSLTNNTTQTNLNTPQIYINSSQRTANEFTIN